MVGDERKKLRNEVTKSRKAGIKVRLQNISGDCFVSASWRILAMTGKIYQVPLLRFREASAKQSWESLPRFGRGRGVGIKKEKG
jgi:hypothetical protein